MNDAEPENTTTSGSSAPTPQAKQASYSPSQTIPSVPERKAAFDRACLINDEVDRLVLDAAERGQSIATKASFLAVSSGVVITALTAQIWTEQPVLGVVAVGAACVGLMTAAFALRPGSRAGLSAKTLTDSYLDATISAEQLQSVLTRKKAEALHLREIDMRQRAQWTWVGFAALGIAAVLLAILFSFEVLGE